MSGYGPGVSQRQQVVMMWFLKAAIRACNIGPIYNVGCGVPLELMKVGYIKVAKEGYDNAQRALAVSISAKMCLKSTFRQWSGTSRTPSKEMLLLRTTSVVFYDESYRVTLEYAQVIVWYL